MRAIVAALLLCWFAAPAASTISGRVTEAGSRRPLPRIVVTLVGADGSELAEALTDDDGRYRFTGVGAGRYAVSAGPGEHRSNHLRQWYGEKGPAPRWGRPPRYPLDMADGRDIADVDIAMLVALGIEGRVLSPWGMNRTFTLTGVFGRRTLEVFGVPEGWYVKQVRYRGDDVIDKAIDYARTDGPGSLEIVLSNRGATITGRVIDDTARPVRSAFVWLLHLDGDTVTEVAATAYTSATGELRLGPLRAGEYVAVAFASRVRPLERDDRVRAAKLVSLGERVRLAEYDERAIELRVIREEPR